MKYCCLDKSDKIVECYVENEIIKYLNNAEGLAEAVLHISTEVDIPF